MTCKMTAVVGECGDLQCKEADFVLSVNTLSTSSCLDLSKKAISDLPEEITRYKHLECLYLEGNLLRNLPASFFSSCSNLHWLDLRNNLLTHLSPSIQLLKGLKTLLLQGNQLTSLPLELGELRQLNGLSLASNPLTSPPLSIVKRGTNAVLHYLRGQLKARNEEEKKEQRGSNSPPRVIHTDERDSNSDSGDEYATVSRQSIRKAPILHHIQEATKHRPLVLLKQAHIHPHPPPSSPSHSPSTNHQQARTVQRRERRKTTKQQATVEERGGQERQLVTDLKDRGERLGVHVHPLSSEEKLHANILIEKQRSKERLQQWRAEAKLDHLKPTIDLPHTIETAPYATEHNNIHTQNQSGQDSSLLHSALRMSIDDDREEVVRIRVQHYNKTLQNQRRQAGLISEASSGLIDAERKLAEALALRDAIKDWREREYRLTAFTADPNLL